MTRPLSSDELQAVTLRSHCCFLCVRILETVRGERELRNWPLGSGGDIPVDFPVDAQLWHAERELSYLSAQRT